MSLIAYTPVHSTLNVEISLNGAVSGLHTYLIKLECKYELNKIPYCKMHFVGSNPDHTPESNLLESDLLVVNDSIEVFIINGTDRETLFKGIIYRVERNSELSSGFEIKIECKDVCINLMSQQEVVSDESFETKMNRFLTNEGISNEVQMRRGGDEIVSKTSNVSPWDYIVSYLDTLGYMTKVRDGSFNIIDITQELPAAVYLAENGVNIFSYEGREEQSVANVEIRTWNPETQEVVTQDDSVDSESGNGTETLDLSQTNYSQETVNQILLARSSKNRLASVKGSLKTFGNLQAILGNQITFDKINQTVDGNSFLISSEHHSIENGCWDTEYSIGLQNNQSFRQQVSSSSSSSEDIIGQTNSLNGLQIGIVTKIEGDPRNQYRVKVRLPRVSETGEGVWARLASLQAGSSRGGFFIPEVNDEVVLGCFDNNPDTPVILGKLYSSAHPMPYEIEEANPIQGIVSKEGTRVIIDDAKKIVEISTQSNKKLIIGDDVKGFYVQDNDSGSTFTINDKGITLSSKKDIILKADGKIKIEGAEHSYNASGMMNLSGATINLN